MFKQFIPTILACGVMSVVAGCNSLQDHCNDVWLSCRSNHQAKSCYREMKDCYSEVCYPRDFRRGFMQGYEDRVAGGSGCPPLLPPRHYWKPCYMNPEGHCKTIEWFNGYAHGALAADQCGANGYGSIPISPQFKGSAPTHASHQAPYPDHMGTSLDYQSLNGPVGSDTMELPTNSEINIPPVPVQVKPYE